MFEIRVTTEFCAAHALVIRGLPEPTHGHNFRATLTIAGDRLDPDGLLVDFHLVERCLAEIVRPFINADLSRTPPFNASPPHNASAEHIAQHIADSLAALLSRTLDPDALARNVRVVSCEVTEAPGCVAVYTPSE